jgi:hypothetical protein
MPLELSILDTNIESPGRGTLAHIAGVNERRYARFKAVQFAISAQRMEYHHQVDNFQYILDRLQKSVGALNSGVTGGKTEPPLKRSKARLKRLESRLRTDAEELTRHIQSTVLLMTRLQEGERQAEEVGDALGSSLQTLSTALRRNGFNQNDGGPLHTSVSLVPTPSSRSEDFDVARSPMADELANFCDAVGDFKIMRERIDELYLEKHEQEERRDFLGDQELKLEEGSEQFLLQWHQSLANAEKDYQQAEVAVRLAREACEAADISIPPWAEPDQAFDEVLVDTTDAAQPTTVSPPVSSMLQQSSGHVMGSSTNSSEVVLVAASSRMSNSLKVFDSLNNAPASGDKVTRWIENIPHDVPDPSSGTFSLPARKDDPGMPDTHKFEYHTVQQIRRIRSWSSLPSATRPQLSLKLTASCPSIIHGARNYGQPLNEIQFGQTPRVALTPVPKPDAPQRDDDTTEFPPLSKPPQDR